MISLYHLALSHLPRIGVPTELVLAHGRLLLGDLESGRDLLVRQAPQLAQEALGVRGDQLGLQVQPRPEIFTLKV